MREAWTIHWINWPVHSNQVAKRNAQRAATICAQRRREREDVDVFVASVTKI
jgi:hypothetical protein